MQLPPEGTDAASQVSGAQAGHGDTCWVSSRLPLGPAVSVAIARSIARRSCARAQTALSADAPGVGEAIVSWSPTPSLPRSDDNKDAMIRAIALSKNPRNELPISYLF